MIVSYQYLFKDIICVFFSCLASPNTGYETRDSISLSPQIKIQLVNDIEAVLFGAFVVAAARRQDDDVQLFLHVQKDCLAAPAAVQQ